MLHDAKISRGVYLTFVTTAPGTPNKAPSSYVKLGGEGARDESSNSSLSSFVGLKNGHVSQDYVRSFGDVQAVQVCNTGILGSAKSEKKGHSVEDGRKTTHLENGLIFSYIESDYDGESYT